MVLMGLNNSLPPLIIPSPLWDRDSGLVAQPLLLRWNRCRWKPKRAMNTLEARNPHFSRESAKGSGVIYQNTLS